MARVDDGEQPQALITARKATHHAGKTPTWGRLVQNQGFTASQEPDEAVIRAWSMPTRSMARVDDGEQPHALITARKATHHAGKTPTWA